MKQYALRSNFGLQISPQARANVNVGYNDMKLIQPFGGGGGFFQGLVVQTVTAPGYRTPRDGNAVQWTGDIFSVEISTREKRFTGGFTIEYEPFPWLRLRGVAGIDQLNGFGYTMQRLGEGVVTGWGSIVAQNGGRYVQRRNLTRYSFDVGGNATWTYSPDISLRAAVGAQYFQDQRYTTFGDGFDLLPGATTLTSASRRTVGESTDENATYGAFVEGGATWRNRLFVTTGLRTDKNSAFGLKQGTVIYPRASLSWVISEESFLPLKNVFDDVRLRSAWGKAGVQPTSTAALAYFGSSLIPVDGAALPGLRISSLGNQNLQPETTTEYEFGADLGMLDGRLRFEATYFHKKSEDALISVQLPPSVAAGTTQFSTTPNTSRSGTWNGTAASAGRRTARL